MAREKTYPATFTEKEMFAVRDALSTETVRMRGHHKNMENLGKDVPKSSLDYLATLESLLAWAKRECFK